MALIKCPECNKEFSDKALACPSCGFPTSKIIGTKNSAPVVINDSPQKHRFTWLKLVIPLFIIIILSTVFFLFFYISNIFLSNHEVVIGIGEEADINYTIQPERTVLKSVKWISSDDQIAAVNNGKITGVSEGTCKITVESLWGHYDNCTVIVKSVEDRQADLVNELCDYIKENSDVNSENTYMKTVKETNGNQFILCYGKNRLSLIYNIPSDYGEQMTCLFIEAGNIKEAIVMQISTLKIDGKVMQTTGKGTIQLGLYKPGDKIPIWNIEAENAPDDAEIGLTDEFQKVVDTGVKEDVLGFEEFLKNNPHFGSINQYGFAY